MKYRVPGFGVGAKPKLARSAAVLAPLLGKVANDSDTRQDSLSSNHDNSTTSGFTKILSLQTLTLMIDSTTL